MPDIYLYNIKGNFEKVIDFPYYTKIKILYNLHSNIKVQGKIGMLVPPYNLPSSNIQIISALNSNTAIPLYFLELKEYKENEDLIIYKISPLTSFLLKNKKDNTSIYYNKMNEDKDLWDAFLGSDYFNNIYINKNMNINNDLNIAPPIKETNTPALNIYSIYNIIQENISILNNLGYKLVAKNRNNCIDDLSISTLSLEKK